MSHDVAWLLWTFAAVVDALIVGYCYEIQPGVRRSLLNVFAFVVVLEIGKHMGRSDI